ncbi:Holliday junction branch migration protein RuvA [Thermocoleostomius sinensis]|jgi:Holliday junction DNA helicase RuvA|uniref:Holliday junction branch migration complex subunit RuvA n=1 Tax=Thermocoleostomius sinensis A174 TaxID=2016057 RepID=A0A9E9C9W8_9CYAN|nr:Holliday junction branch migration protein RuvA [Thermocoleostomius sinensis]WAL58205.1 Holliday junction branch migration protein RuvA [Thermocoleostomius sinensis A174]
MISYLKGTVAGIQKVSSSRVILTLEVNQVGYDLQITSRLMQHLLAIDEAVQVFTHLQIREDQMILFGFGSTAERDLFRQLISVSGIGPQVAMALLDGLSLPDLVQAIVSSNTRVLTQAPGVGAKTAERLALELKTKLAEWRNQSGLATLPDAGPTANVREDVEMTLLALGYTGNEITQALQAVGQKTALAKNSNAEDWIREAIAWLSQ